MKIIECLIFDKITIDDKEYYPIQNVYGNEEYKIPSSQIELFESLDLNKKYKFLGNYDKDNNQTYYSIIHPNYNINSKNQFVIKGIQETDNKKYFILDSDYFKPLSVICFDGQEELVDVECAIVGYKKGRPVLKNIDSGNKNWTVGDIKEFKIRDQAEIEGKKGDKYDALEVFVDEIESKTVKVKIYEWQNLKHWKFKTIKCKIDGITTDGNPKLRPYDERHPYYNIKSKYKFIYDTYIEKVDNKSNRFFLIKLKDEFSLSYDVKAFPSQEMNFKKGDVIECIVEDICYKVKLKQINRDPFFNDYENIDQSKYNYDYFFKPYLESQEDFSLKLSEQYFNKSAFWVFTYCNQVIPFIKYRLLKNKNLTHLKILIENQILFEEWILKSGLLKAIKSTNDRKSIKNKAESVLNLCHIEKEVIEKITSLKLNQHLKENNTSFSLQEIYFIIQYASIQTLEAIDFIFIKNIDFKDKDRYILRKIARIIERQKKEYYSEGFKEYFIPSSIKNFNEKRKFQKYLEWSYIQIVIYAILKDNRNFNFKVANIYRFYSQISDKNKNRKKLLFNAFDLLSNINEEINQKAISFNKKIEIDLNCLKNIPQRDTVDEYSELYKAKITEKHYKGFNVTVENYIGYLPIHNVSDTKLKQYPFSEIKWETNVDLSLISEDFKFVIVKQFEKDSDNFYSKNLKEIPKLKKGSIIHGIVKSIEDYGVFITTDYGDGLIHKSQISFELIEPHDLYKIFKVNEEVFVKVLNYTKDKIELTFKGLIGSKYDDYYLEKLELIDIDNYQKQETYDFQFGIEYEKGVIFENYAIIQERNIDKIKYLKIAKAFYSNTQDSRSYLLNIYIEYFQSIDNLEILLENYKYENYNEFKKKTTTIKDKIQPKTLETYPESKNLLFFIDILNLFNSKEDADIIKLFDIIKNPIKQNDFKLKTVAKIALANNLMISDINETNNKDEIDEFTLKNLKKINKFLNYGVHSVEEPIEDRHAKELKQKIKYIKSLISQDEGQKLEFKATFKTPIPPKEKERVIINLEKKLENSSYDKKKIIAFQIQKIKEESKNVPNIEKKLYHNVFKTLCAFANTDGGILLIGVKDDQNIFGLEQDYNSFRINDRGRDGFAKHFDNLVSDYLGKGFSSNYLKTEFIRFPEGDIFFIEVKPSSEEVFLNIDENGAEKETLYVRNTASSYALNGRELAIFIKNKFESRIKNNFDSLDNHR